MIEKIENIVIDLPFENVKEEINSLKEKLSKSNLNIVLVGEFNAGKSSLINSYYGISLPTNITPETATIWKVIISDENKIVVKFKDNTKKIVNSEDEVKNLNQQEISYIDYYIKSENNNGVIIVDTPGLSSLDDFHKEALEGYIQEADVVLVLADVAQGLVKSTIDFLNNNIENSQKLYLILTKSDIVSQNDIERQKNYIKDKFKFLQDVIAVSQNDISELQTILEKILQDKESIIKHRVEIKLKSICKFLIPMIDKQIKLNQNSSSEELLKEMKEVRKKRDEIYNLIRNERVKFEGNLDNYIKELQDDFENILKSKVEWIVDALYDENLKESIDDRFQQAIQLSLKEALSSFETKINKKLSEIENTMNLKTDLSNDFVINIADNVVVAREFIVEAIEKISQKWPQVYVIVKSLKHLLREVIDLLSQMVTKSFVVKKVESMIDTISPNIKSTIYTQIKNLSDELFEVAIKDLNAQKEDYLKMLEDIEKKLDASKEQKESEIEKLRDKKSQLQQICGGEK